MNKLAVSELRPGMAFDKPVYIDADNMLVKSNEQISKNDIEKLLKWSINEVQTDGQSVDVIQKFTEEELSAEEKKDIADITKKLKNTIKSKQTLLDILFQGEKLVEEAYTSIMNERPFQITKIRGLAEKITNLLDEAPYIIAFLYSHVKEISIYKHVINVSFFSYVLAKKNQYTRPKIVELLYGVLLMDIGMVKIPKSISNTIC